VQREKQEIVGDSPMLVGLLGEIRAAHFDQQGRGGKLEGAFSTPLGFSRARRCMFFSKNS
jgi:hypothetical protein